VEPAKDGSFTPWLAFCTCSPGANREGRVKDYLDFILSEGFQNDVVVPGIYTDDWPCENHYDKERNAGHETA